MTTYVARAGPVYSRRYTLVPGPVYSRRYTLVPGPVYSRRCTLVPGPVYSRRYTLVPKPKAKVSELQYSSGLAMALIPAWICRLVRIERVLHTGQGHGLLC